MKTTLLILTFSFFLHVAADDQFNKSYGQKCGHWIYEQLDPQCTLDIPLDIEDVIQGLRDAKASLPPPLTNEEFYQKSKEIEDTKYENLSKNNLEEAEAYISTLTTNPDIQALIENKLYIQTLREGSGDAINLNSKAIFAISASYINKDPYFTSSEEGTSQDLAVAIEGFQKGVAGMKINEKRKIYIHPDLGYGKVVFSNPNKLIITDVELIKIISK